MKTLPTATAATLILVLAACSSTPEAAPAPTPRPSETYACRYEQVLTERGVCEGRDRGQWAEFEATPEDPRLTDGTHEVTWASRSELPCAAAIQLAAPFKSKIEAAFIDNAGSPKAVSRALSAVADELATVTKSAEWGAAMDDCHGEPNHANDAFELQMMPLTVSLATLGAENASADGLIGVMTEVLTKMQAVLLLKAG
ncbi:hypothetical protein AB0F88_17025 [Streptosporangium sp. NPDC023963]|uniref:hypothetical protein n=1 Tax=Streptosporangium sp. NPDC023963 TaxID=3155608 RepID=UPI0034477526